MNRRIRKSRRLRAALGGVLGAGLIVAGTGASEAEAVTLIKSDLDFILQQIKMAENHAAGNPLLGTGPLQVSNPLFPYGLRTVDGRDNNLLPGQGNFGAADQRFPRLTSPLFREAEVVPDLDGPGPMTSGPTHYNQTTGIVWDSRPRTISNLIADSTPSNPAAGAAAAQTDGSAQVDDGNPVTPPSADPFFIPNRTPDEGLSAPYNSWFTLFGQFFDHGLDLVNKGGNGTVMVPLKDDDPLVAGPNGTFGDADDLPAHLRFMVLTRATNQDGGGSDDPGTLLIDESLVHEHVNQTTPWVDQNQTYTSHPSHQVFLREYELNADGKAVSNGRLLDRPGALGGLARWVDVKAQAASMLGIALGDMDALNLPVLKTDPYGKFEPGPNGFAQIATTVAGLTVHVEGTADGLAVPANAQRTGHAFLDDIAHHAVPFGDHDNNQATPRIPLEPDASPGMTDDGNPATYDDELLGAHFVTGDGRGNENIGLTSVHHVFHSEHNRLVDHIKSVILATGNVAFLNEWLIVDVASIPADTSTLVWDGERLFQAARFGTEMQYQHLVFEEFARKVQPEVNVFAGYQTDINPAIAAEFAHTVYRFGHSMLTETVARTNADGSLNDIGLIQAFLNPLAFNDGGPAGEISSDAAAGSVVAGMSRQVGNELDEFVTDALRTNLLGLPLDLATINLTRARDTGIPSLQGARREFYAASAHPLLEPYSSWADFGLSLRHPESLVNFIAAYGKHPDLLAETTLAGKRKVATAIVTNTTVDGYEPPTDRIAFLNSTEDWATTFGSPDYDSQTRTGLGDVDFWIGGLAEKQMPFGGLLGSTFNYVFEAQLEKLQDGDRFYYLGRTAGLNFLTELENNSFATLIQRNTEGLVHPPADIFSRPDFIIEAGNNPPLADDPETPDDESELVIEQPDGTLRFVGGEHVVMGGTPGTDRMRAGIGDDTMWGDAGPDRLEGDAGNDVINGGDGDDIITDQFGVDVLKGNDGDDAISVGTGTGDLTIAGPGKDFVVQGDDEKEAFLGTGDDFVKGSDGMDIIFGNEGDDWIEGGHQADLLQGGNGAPFQDDTITGDDVIIGGGGNDDYDSEGGDDIMVSGLGTERFEGMLGYDWVTHQNDPLGANADMNFTGFQPPDEDNVRDRFDDVEGLSGWNRSDILRGDDGEIDGGEAADHSLTNPGLIAGIDQVIGTATTVPNTTNIILGGGGSDILEGRGGDDIIDGDLQLEVYLQAPGGPKVTNMTPLQAQVFNGTLDPGDIQIVREIVTGADPGSDTAVFSDVRANYEIVPNPDDPTETTVIHLGGAGIDGTDIVRKVERLQFSDQTVVLDGSNPVPTGAPTVSDATPTEDQLLTASAAAVSDPNGINLATLAFQWQAETDPGVWTTVGTGPSFTPGDAEVGLALRVVATFQDGLGVLESATSAPTALVINVNDPATGTPAINDTTPETGQVLTATRGSIADLDGLENATLTFQWQQSSNGTTWTNLGAPGTTSPAVPASRMIRVVASFVDDNGTAESRTSEPTLPTPGPFPLSLSGLRVQSLASTASVSVKLTTAASLRLDVHNTKGKLVRRIVSKANKAGIATLRWNKRAANGKRVKPGMYRFVIVAKTTNGQQKIVAKWVKVK
jgi:Ca2+-binding RTX toxin-like protein